MDDQDQTMTHHMDPSRPALGFPLGTALLLIVVFSLSAIFSCCYHWDKIQSLRRSLSGHADPGIPTVQSPSKSTAIDEDPKQNQNQSFPVMMPGDQIPKYIAWPCPCEPSPMEKITIDVQKPT